MEDYEFYLDRKVTIWERNKFEIKAKSKKQAIEFIKSKFSKEKDTLDFEGDCEFLYETVEFLPAKENQAPTIEIFDKKNDKLILSNWEDY